MKNSTTLNKAALPAENPAAIKSILLSCMVAGAVFSARAQDQRIASPDGKLVAEFSMDTPGVPYYRIHKDGKVILESSRLGLIRDDEDFSTHLKLIAASDIKPVIDDYVIWTAKRSHNSYRANVRVFQLKNQHGKPMDVLFQVSDHGVAYRYRFPDQSDSKQIIREERSSFHFLPDTKAWLQPMSEAKTGWARTNPSYEEYHQQEIPAGTPSTFGAGWTFPALFKTQDTWLLVSEGSLSRGFCGSRLRHESPDREYTIGYPDSREGMNGGPVNPVSTRPWATPWRFIVIGDLKTIAESTWQSPLNLIHPPTRPAKLHGAGLCWAIRKPPMRYR